jgi:hypothetical protein
MVELSQWSNETIDDQTLVAPTMHEVVNAMTTLVDSTEPADGEAYFTVHINLMIISIINFI